MRPIDMSQPCLCCSDMYLSTVSPCFTAFPQLWNIAKSHTHAHTHNPCTHAHSDNFTGFFIQLPPSQQSSNSTHGSIGWQNVPTNRKDTEQHQQGKSKHPKEWKKNYSLSQLQSFPHIFFFFAHLVSTQYREFTCCCKQLRNGMKRLE